MAASVTRRIQEQRTEKRVREEKKGTTAKTVKTDSPKAQVPAPQPPKAKKKGSPAAEQKVLDFAEPPTRKIPKSRRETPRRSILIEALVQVIADWNATQDAEHLLFNAKIVECAQSVGCGLNSSGLSLMLNGRKDLTGDSMEAILLALREFDERIVTDYLTKIQTLLPTWTIDSGNVLYIPSKRSRMNEENSLSLYMKAFCQRENLTKEAFLAWVVKSLAPISLDLIEEIWNNPDYVPTEKLVSAMTIIFRRPSPGTPLSFDRPYYPYEYFEALFQNIADRVNNQHGQQHKAG